MFGCLSLAVGPRERGSAHTKALLPPHVRTLLPAPILFLPVPIPGNRSGAGGLLLCHTGEGAWALELERRVQGEEMLHAGMFCAEMHGLACWQVEQVLERSKMLLTFSLPLPLMPS